MPLSEATAHYLPALRDTIQAAILEQSGELLDMYQTMLTYHMGWTDQHGASVERDSGKQIRPLLCLLVADACGDDWRVALPAAASLEILHNFTLVHDDIQDASPLRRGQPTLWSIWGEALAINAGDALFALAHLAMMDLIEKGASAEVTVTALRILDETCVALTRGQYLDMSFEKREKVETDTYLQMIGGKSAELLAVSARLGALVSGASPEQVEDFYRYGLNLGMAFQVIDDILGIWGAVDQTGKSDVTDLHTKKKSLPVLYGLQQSSALRELYAGPDLLDAQEVILATEILESAGVRTYTEEVAARYTAQALKHLDAAAPQGQPDIWLRELTEFLLLRDF